VNQNLKKIMDELALIHPHEREFKDGFTAAIPPVREDILKVLEESGYSNLNWLREKLKRMDENE